MSLEPVIEREVSQKEKKKQILYINSYIQNLENCIDEPGCREGMKMQIQRTNWWTQLGKQRVGQIHK